MTRRTWRGRAALTGTGTVLAVLASGLAVPAQSAPMQAAAVDECPAAVPVSSVTEGMTGEGLTVVKGRTPQPFDVEVLGVLDDGIGAGRDMILIKVSDQAGKHVIDQGGGIWAGMSGSPVYVDGKLLGAVSYGFTSTTSPIGGLTPAEDMYKVLNLPSVAAARPVQAKAATSVKLTAAQRKALGAKAQVATPRGSLRQLAVPLAMGGVSAKRVDAFQTAADKAGLAVKAYSSGRAAAPSAVPAATPTAGGNFAAALAYGDATLAGIGTTTAVCGNRALAFGHPLLLSGPADYGANDADAKMIVNDGSWGAYKLASVGDSFGSVDQDRTTALRSDLTATPNTTTITTTVHNGDTGAERTGTTQVTTDAFLSIAAIFATWANDDAVFDEWGDGTATHKWTITGTRADGKPFTLTRSDRFADQSDVTIDPSFELADTLDTLIYNDFEKVTIDNVDVDTTFRTAYQQFSIKKVQVKVNGKYVVPKSVTTKAGATLSIRVGVQPYRQTTLSYRVLKLKVPKEARGQSGELSVTGGAYLGFDDELDLACLLLGDCDEQDSEGSFDKLLASIASTPRNDAIQADLSIETDEDVKSVAVATKHASQVVTGAKSISVRIR